MPQVQYLEGGWDGGTLFWALEQSQELLSRVDVGSSGLLFSSPDSCSVFLQDLTHSDPPWHHCQSGGVSDF